MRVPFLRKYAKNMKQVSHLENWMHRIRNEESLPIKHVGGLLGKISPAEKIRFEENKKLGSHLATLLRYFTRAKELTRDALIEETAQLRLSLHPSQQKILSDLLEQALEDDERFQQMSREEICECSDRALEKTPGFTFRLAGIPATDLERRPFGITVVYVRDEQRWRNELSIFSNTSSGFHISFANHVQSALRETRDETGAPSSVSVHLPLTIEERDQIRRLIFIFQPQHTDKKRSDEIIQHEMAHVFFDRWVYDRMDVREETELAKAAFLAMKDEWIAYVQQGEWRFFLGHLLNVSVEDDVVLSYRIRDLIAHEYQDHGEMDESHAKEEATSVTNHIWAARTQVMRLNLLQSTSFEEAMSVMIGAQSFKELAYQLSCIDRRAINLLRILHDSTGKARIYRLYDAVFLASRGLTKVTHVAEVRKELEDLLRDPAKVASNSEEKRFIDMTLELLRPNPKPTP